MELGFFAALMLALDIYTIWNILHEPWEGFKKILWIILIAMFQLIPVIIYFLFFRTVKAPFSSSKK